MSNSKELQRKIERLKKEIERLCKARAEAKFTWIMPSRSQRCDCSPWQNSSKLDFAHLA